MDLQSFFKSKVFTRLLVGLGAVIAALIIFDLGMFVGYQKANFSYRWSENYHRNFAGPRQGFFEEMGGRDFIDSHGVAGVIIKLNDDSLVIKGRGDVEQIILLASDTAIQQFRQTIKADGLRINDMIVVIGDPDGSGRINAKLIRVLPPPPASPFPAATGTWDQPL